MRTRLSSIFIPLALLLWSGVASAQQPDENDPTAVTAPGQDGTSSRPGVITRPSNPEPDPEPDENDSEDEEDGEDSAQNSETDSDGNEDEDGNDNNIASGNDDDDEDDGPRGPRTLEVEDVAPDVGEIDGNFPDELSWTWDSGEIPTNVMVNIDFNDADLSDVVMWISALTGRNFIIADTISASKKITIISPQPVSIPEAYRAFIAALNMNGLTIVPFGSFLKIVESGDAQRQALEPTTSVSQIPADDRMVTHIHQLQHVSLDQVSGVLEALKSEAGQIVTYEPTNTLIITEAGLNLRRMLDVLRRLDVPSGQEQIHMYQVQYASAEDLSSVLLEIFSADDQESSGSGSSRRRSRRDDDEEAEEGQNDNVVDLEGASVVSVSQIIADNRTNQLIIISTESAFDQVLTIIEQLDVPIPGEGQVHVLFLENADATELASTLQSLTQTLDQQREESGNRFAADDGGEGATGAVSASLTGEVSVTADESTNSLVVVASTRDFVALQDVIRQLDRRRQQVYVEAVIMEVSLGRNNDFGVAFNGGALPTISGEESPLFGATSVGGLSSLSLDPSSIMGLTVGLSGPSIEGSESTLGIGIPAFGAVLQASQTDNDVNILSTPHLLTMDNEEAEIVVGENIPFISGGTGVGSALGGLGGLGALSSLGDVDTSSLGNLGGLTGLSGLGGFPSFNIQRQDVALTMRLTPQINESDFVRLELELEVEDVQSIDPVLGPSTTTRQARTTVVAQDQQTIVIAGLMRDSHVRDVNKVPFLGDIPLLGLLFRQTVNRDTKTNLLLLLTPYIIRSPADFREIYRRKMEERDEFIAYFGRRTDAYIASVDYGRKDGPLQSAYETIQAAIEEEEDRRRAFGSTTTETPLDQAPSEPLRLDLDGE